MTTNTNDDNNNTPSKDGRFFIKENTSFQPSLTTIPEAGDEFSVDKNEETRESLLDEEFDNQNKEKEIRYLSRNVMSLHAIPIYRPTNIELNLRNFTQSANDKPITETDDVVMTPAGTPIEDETEKMPDESNKCKNVFEGSRNCSTSQSNISQTSNKNVEIITAEVHRENDEEIAQTKLHDEEIAQTKLPSKSSADLSCNSDIGSPSSMHICSADIEKIPLRSMRSQYKLVPVNVGNQHGGSNLINSRNSSTLILIPIGSKTSQKSNISCNSSSRPTPGDLNEIKIFDPSSILKGIVAYVDVKTGCLQFSNSIKKLLLSMGAKTESRFSKQVNLVVFKDGSLATYKKAKNWKVPLVNVSWVTDCKKAMANLPKTTYIPEGLDGYEASILKSMETCLLNIQKKFRAYSGKKLQIFLNEVKRIDFGFKNTQEVASAEPDPIKRFNIMKEFINSLSDEAEKSQSRRVTQTPSHRRENLRSQTNKRTSGKQLRGRSTQNRSRSYRSTSTYSSRKSTRPSHARACKAPRNNVRKDSKKPRNNTKTFKKNNSNLRSNKLPSNRSKVYNLRSNINFNNNSTSSSEASSVSN